MTTEVETLPHEVPAEEEPRYLRRQKPVEIRRRKFGKRSWPAYRRVVAFGAVVVAGGFLIYTIASFFLSSPHVRLSRLGANRTFRKQIHRSRSRARSVCA